jgi:hypothetical protein
VLDRRLAERDGGIVLWQDAGERTVSLAGFGSPTPGGPETYPDHDSAVVAEAEARAVLRSNARVGVTVREFWNDWTSDPLWLRPARSTKITNRAATHRFITEYGDLPLRSIGDEQVAAWLKGGRNVGTVPALRAFFNDAASPPLGGSSTATHSRSSASAQAEVAATRSRRRRSKSRTSSRSPTN